MTKYVALRERNQPRIGFHSLMESPEPLDCRKIRAPGPCKRLYVRSADRTTSVRISKKSQLKKVLRKDHHDHKTNWNPKQVTKTKYSFNGYITDQLTRITRNVCRIPYFNQGLIFFWSSYAIPENYTPYAKRKFSIATLCAIHRIWLNRSLQSHK